MTVFLKNVNNQTVIVYHWFSLSIFKSMGTETVWLSHHHSSKYRLLCSTEEWNSYRCGTTW